MLSAYTIDVTFATHEDLKAARIGGWHRVTVLAPSGDEASLIAAQIVTSTQDAVRPGTMPIQADHCI